MVRPGAHLPKPMRTISPGSVYRVSGGGLDGGASDAGFGAVAAGGDGALGEGGGVGNSSLPSGGLTQLRTQCPGTDRPE